MLAAMNETHTASRVKQLPAPTVKKLLRAAGYSLIDVARLNKRHHSLVTRVVRKQSVSEPVWARIAWCLNHPKKRPVARTAPSNPADALNGAATA